MNSTTDDGVNKNCTGDAQPGIGHNRMPLGEAAKANVQSGVLLLCKEALITAIQDRRLHRDHLRVLAAIAMFVNTQTAKAWPSRSAIASVTGLTVRGVSNALLQLRNWGYLIADRETVEEADNKRLTVYTFGNIDHEEIRRQITNICLELQKKRAATETKSPQKVTKKKSPPKVTVTSEGDEEVTSQGDLLGEKVTPQGARKSPPRVHSNSKREQSKTSPNGDGAGAPSEEAMTIRQLIWEHGLRYLRSVYRGSVTEGTIRNRLGVMIKEYTIGPVLAAMDEAQRQQPMDPLDYMQGVLRKKAAPAPQGYKKPVVF